ncbi:hypothetical protein LCGC14_2581080 [marine sediment metagenome]|uniref:VRR-NUC domain-containing protein n=1 Tax=marine sediment metagenome TaxID=412755 RepID=A0A0F9D759_9ZZZZ
MAAKRKAQQQAPISEKAFQAQIVDAARALSWYVFHVYDSRRSSTGFPDLELIRGATMLRLEVKTEDGVVADEQQAYIDRLNQVKYVVADVVRPSHWDEVLDTLKRAAR